MLLQYYYTLKIPTCRKRCQHRDHGQSDPRASGDHVRCKNKHGRHNKWTSHFDEYPALSVCVYGTWVTLLTMVVSGDGSPANVWRIVCGCVRTRVFIRSCAVVNCCRDASCEDADERPVYKWVCVSVSVQVTPSYILCATCI